MNMCAIVGNLTHAPELRATQDGTPVCNFTVAVNRRRAGGGNQEADYFRVTVWRVMGENCARYLDKGRKVAVTGAVSARAYTGSDGAARASLEITADTVEFLTPRQGDHADGCARPDEMD